MIVDVQALIDSTINEDTAYSKKPLELRYQRTYAVKVWSHTKNVKAQQKLSLN